MKQQELKLVIRADKYEPGQLLQRYGAGSRISVFPQVVPNSDDRERLVAQLQNLSVCSETISEKLSYKQLVIVFFHHDLRHGQPQLHMLAAERNVFPKDAA